MKSVWFNKYGIPEKVLKITEIYKPSPQGSEVLVKIYSTTINDYECCLVTGKPRLYRLIFGIFKPKYQIPGMELAGIVEAVGENVQNFKIGDAVFGDTSDYGFGTHAEYICIDENALVKKPKFISFEEAVAVPHAFGLALQALRDIGEITKGQQILINGGGGGVGTLGLQIAKFYDCEVTGFDSEKKLEMMKSVGFDKVFDYRKNNFNTNGIKYDIILDCKTNKAAFCYLKSLKPNGKYICIGGDISSLINVFFFGKLVALFSSKKLKVLGLKPNKDLDFFIELFSQNRIKPIIDGPYQFEDIPKLITYFGKGNHKGKIVIKIV